MCIVAPVALRGQGLQELMDGAPCFSDALEQVAFLKLRSECSMSWRPVYLTSSAKSVRGTEDLTILLLQGPFALGQVG